MSKEYGTKGRLLRVMLAILEQPFRYTKKQLAAIYGVDESIIKADLTAFRNAGLVIEYDENYRYGFRIENPMKQLSELLHFSEEDQLLLDNAIEIASKNGSKRAEILKKKLASLYDFRKLGHSYLRKPYLQKLDILEAAKNSKKVVLLKDYRSSNSNIVADRTVEAFHYNAAEDILHAYDLDKQGLRHFRISRIMRIEASKENWKNEKLHHVIATDPFRIVDNNQVFVHLRLRVGAYNELVERFPLCIAHIVHDSEKDIFDFQCKVNSKFYGITNFILGYHHQLVEIVEPESLLAHLRKNLVEMQNKWR